MKKKHLSMPKYSAKILLTREKKTNRQLIEGRLLRLSNRFKVRLTGKSRKDWQRYHWLKPVKLVVQCWEGLR